MRAQSSQNADVFLNLKGKAVAFGNSPFPDIAGIVHFFDVQRRMAPVIEKKPQLFISRFLDAVPKNILKRHHG